jgi:hypothetical protein
MFWFLSSNFMKLCRNIRRSVWKLLVCWSNSKRHYHGNWGTQIMGWGDVRSCIPMAILVKSPWLLSGDVLLFYVSFSLLLHHPDCCRLMYCYSTFLFHYYYYYSYYYITPTVVGWCIAILRFFFTIIITSPRLLSGDVLLFYFSFSLLLLFFHTFLSARFLRDAFIKLYETL